MPLTRIDLRWRENELAAAAHGRDEAVGMLKPWAGRSSRCNRTSQRRAPRFTRWAAHAWAPIRGAR